MDKNILSEYADMKEEIKERQQAGSGRRDSRKQMQTAS